MPRQSKNVPIGHVVMYLYIGTSPNTDIAKRVGVSGSTCDRIMRSFPDHIKEARIAARKAARHKNVSEAAELRCLGASVREINEATGIGVEAIYKASTPCGCPTVGKLTEIEKLGVMIDYTEPGATTRSVARKYGVSHDTIARIVKGIKDE